MTIGHSLANSAGIILSIDRTITDLMQFSRDEVIGQSYLDITYPPDRVRNEQEVARVGEDVGSLTIRKRYLRADGTPITFDVEVSRLSGGGDDGHLVGTLRLVEAPRRPDRRLREIWNKATDSWRGARARTPAYIVRKLWLQAQADLCAERSRRRHFGGVTLGDPTWTLLLHLYLAEIQGRGLNLRELDEIDGLRPPTVVRMVKLFEQHCLAVCTDQNADVELTDFGLAQIERCLAEKIFE